ncbi:alpha-1,3-galactosyltransferase 2-like [Chanos chanos]|uniref:Alpha-1,3-galactosyltransferase 2-like n=1 Tax=Chanos chanos TaxID=29144 RepID=A0A6J2VAR9_CHACN|nr:alpha-1,3-galactosyltransferase 2-like [Chanos chanos]
MNRKTVLIVFCVATLLLLVFGLIFELRSLRRYAVEITSGDWDAGKHVTLGELKLNYTKKAESTAAPPRPTSVLGNIIDQQLNYGSRTRVLTRTNWNAPIMWEGMYNPKLYDEYHKTRGTTVAMTVFAAGKYLDAYLRKFLISAELHFMVGFPVTYYVFTDAPENVPDIQLAEDRKLKVIKIEKRYHWPEISMVRMRIIADFIKSELHDPKQFIFCMDVDQEFVGRFGSEALGDSVALLHAHFYKRSLREFTYDRNPKSRAYMNEGDFYYHAAIFGGSLQNVKKLTEACDEAMMADKTNGVEALWQDESHLNKYFWINKPSKLLSPEYCWDRSIGDRRDIFVERLMWAPKDYERLRTYG